MLSNGEDVQGKSATKGYVELIDLGETSKKGRRDESVSKQK